MGSAVIAWCYLLGMSIPIFYLCVGKRKRIIDKYESDIQILLILAVLLCLYFLFCSVSLVFISLYFHTGSFKFFILSVYFLLPLFLGIVVYEFLLMLVERRLHLKVMKTPGNVREISRLVGLAATPKVKSTSLGISPLVYGRGRRESVLVLPESMSLLTEKEQHAVITHELSHVYQGDVGFFTWLTILLEGFKYWIPPFPLAYAEFVYSAHSGFSYPFVFELSPDLEAVILFPILVLLLYFSLVFLKSSLSRTRESIADAYTIFHGCDTSLKSALVKYASIGTLERGGIVNLCFHQGAKSRHGLSTHPPLQERLNNIDEKTFLKAKNENFSPVFAFCIGVMSVFLYYSINHFFINANVLFQITSTPEFEAFLKGVIPFVGASSLVAITYVFPITRTPLHFCDLVRKDFFFPLASNAAITLSAAAITSYGLFLDRECVVISIGFGACGLLMSFAGFLNNRHNDFDSRDWYLLFAPFLMVALVWPPMTIIHGFFFHTTIEPQSFVPSMLCVLILGFFALLSLVIRGNVDVYTEKRILFFFKKTKEFVTVSNPLFYLLILFILLIVPTFVSIMFYIVFCMVKAFIAVPGGNLLLLSALFVLLLYFTRITMPFSFLRFSFLLEIASSGNGIEDTYPQFIEKVIRRHQSLDGGFHHEAKGFSNQEGTFIHSKTAKFFEISLNERVLSWILATEREEGGFSFIIDGHAQIEALYYAVQSLSLLEETKNMSRHTTWVLNSFNGSYFSFEYDTCSPLLQTCYAVESLSLLGTLKIQNMDACRQWIMARFSLELTPKEAFFATRALKALNSDMKTAEEWLLGNKRLRTTRIDKNTQNVYYYSKVSYELTKSIPTLIIEQALEELVKMRSEFQGKFI